MWDIWSREEGCCCLSETSSQMINTEALYGWSTSIILPDFRYDANWVSFIKRSSSFWTCHVLYHRALWKHWKHTVNLKHYKFLSIKALHVTFSAVAACLIRLVCVINMDAEESFADCECQMSIRSWVFLCTCLQQGHIFQFLIWCVSDGNIEDQTWVYRSGIDLIIKHGYYVKKKSVEIKVWWFNIWK